MSNSDAALAQILPQLEALQVSEQAKSDSAPMGNLTGPSPLLRGGMIPPNGVQQGMVMGGAPQQPPQGGPTGGPQGPGFNQMGGRPPSRTTTPQMQPGMMMHSSPGMANRALGMGPQQNNAAEFAINNDLFRLPPHQLQQAKAEVGIPQEKANGSLSLNEKKRLLEFCRHRFPKPAPGSSPMMQPPPNLQQLPPQQPLTRSQLGYTTWVPQQNNAAEFAIDSDLFKLPPHQLHQAKAEVGIPQEKDNNSLSLKEKRRSSMMQPPPNLPQLPPQQPLTRSQLGYTTRVPLHQVHNSPGIMQGQLNADSRAIPNNSFNPDDFPGTPGLTLSSTANLMRSAGSMGLVGSDPMMFPAGMDCGSEFDFQDVSSNMSNIVDFERDFGQWFNGPDDLSSGLDTRQASRD